MINPFLCHECSAAVTAPGATCHRCQSKAESKFIFLGCFALAAFILIGVASCRGADASTLAWLAQRESSGNPKAVGKVGELGLYQIREIAVREVNRLKGTHYKHADALDLVKAPKIASHYWDICATRTSGKSREAIHRVYRGLK